MWVLTVCYNLALLNPEIPPANCQKFHPNAKSANALVSRPSSLRDPWPPQPHCFIAFLLQFALSPPKLENALVRLLGGGSVFRFDFLRSASASAANRRFELKLKLKLKQKQNRNSNANANENATQRILQQQPRKLYAMIGDGASSVIVVFSSVYIFTSFPASQPKKKTERESRPRE